MGGEAASREPPERSVLRAAPGAPYAPRFQRGLSLGGFLHAQYVESQLSEDQLSQSGAPLNEDQFSLRRGRLAMSYGAAYAAATLELDASTHRGERIGVRRAEATLLYRSEREVPAFVTLGVTDVPFGYELAESPTSRLFAERSTASLALFPVEMDVGLKIGGSYAFLRYAVALMNGEVSPSGLGQDTNGHKDLVGRLGVDTRHDSETLTVQGGVSFAVGQGLHPGSPARKGGVVWIDENQDGVAQSGEIVGVQGTSARRAQNFDRWALGLDLGLSLSSALGTGRFAVEVYLASNHDRGLFIADPVLQSIDVREHGAAAQLRQELTEYAELGLRIAVYDPHADVIEARRGELVPRDQTQWTFSPAVAAKLPGTARLTVQYDFVRDLLARDARGVPEDAKNDQLTVRLEVLL